MGLFAAHPLRPSLVMTRSHRFFRRFHDSFVLALLIRLAKPFGPHAPRSSLVHHGPISDVPCRIAGASRKLPEPTPDLHSPRVSRRSASVVYPALPDAVVTRPCLRGERVTAPKRLPSSIGPSNIQFEVHPRRSPGLEKVRGSRTRFAPPSPRDRVERISRFFRS
jgi:hypothetical protein